MKFFYYLNINNLRTLILSGFLFLSSYELSSATQAVLSSPKKAWDFSVEQELKCRNQRQIARDIRELNGKEIPEPVKAAWAEKAEEQAAKHRIYQLQALEILVGQENEYRDLARWSLGYLLFMESQNKSDYNRGIELMRRAYQHFSSDPSTHEEALNRKNDSSKLIALIEKEQNIITSIYPTTSTGSLDNIERAYSIYADFSQKTYQAISGAEASYVHGLRQVKFLSYQGLISPSIIEKVYEKIIKG